MRHSTHPRLFLFVLFLSLFLNRHSNAQTGKATNPGIRFLPGDFQNAIEKAKVVHKPLFVEIYLNGCPHCEALAPVLSEKAVGDFYNANFVSWKAEVNSKESAAFQKAKGVTYPEFPILFFFDSNGDLIHLSNPADRPTRQKFIEEILLVGKIALDPLKRTGSYSARFAGGDRDLMFLINYGKHCKTIKDENKLNEINEALAKSLITPQDKTSQAGFYVLQRLINDYENPLSVYFFSHLNEFKSRYPAKDVKEAGEAILYHSLYGSKADSFSVNEIIRMRKSMEDLGVSPQDASARLLLKELDAYMRDKNTSGAVKRFNEYRITAPSLGTADYAYLMKYFNEKSTDTSYLTEIPVWASEGICLAKPEELNSKQMAGLYYELAEAYGIMGQKQVALKNAEQALGIARTAKEDLKRYEDQIEKLK
ncbi:thioredoxin family protein [Dyadobacter sp. NIV53]|uniref:thioredoxin family protein n=1 Tax=Dyadobacter sp. NIV53 TaxID=2861765 RepID=UPI001C882270|nr:thioredoxin family protein [Dyadobacter sp. NIV53]